jgi:hypothetical protein
METLTVSTQEELYRFLEKHGNNRVKRELLDFWGRHPGTKFSRYAICFALDCGKLEADRNLRDMVDAGLLDNHANNGLSFYSLTRNEEKRRLVLELAALGWDQWNILTKRIEQGCGVAKVIM